MILLSVLDQNERAVVHAALMKMIAAAERFEALLSADPETGSDARGIGVGKSAASGRSATKAARRGSAADADFANPIDP